MVVPSHYFLVKFSKGRRKKSKKHIEKWGAPKKQDKDLLVDDWDKGKT